jgi:prolyl-tRNA editing enzyme YbaK/EbsC (Cys-tRNA(Pro) deacylase)
MLEEFIEANNMNAELLESKREIVSQKAVSREAGVSLEKVALTMLLVSENNMLLIAVFPADKILSEEKLISASGFSELKKVSSEECIGLTGYSSESLPPISVYGVKTVIEKSLFLQQEVFCAGGDKMHFLRISPDEIKEFSENPAVEEIVD